MYCDSFPSTKFALHFPDSTSSVALITKLSQYSGFIGLLKQGILATWSLHFLAFFVYIEMFFSQFLYGSFHHFLGLSHYRSFPDQATS
jgi:hypothetical protein